jgi:16S rRNA C1402 N4-methylase RsmH
VPRHRCDALKNLDVTLEATSAFPRKIAATFGAYPHSGVLLKSLEASGNRIGEDIDASARAAGKLLTES